MLVDEKAVDEALDLKKLTLPASLPIVRIEAQDYTDWTGDASLRLLVVLDESVDLDHISGRDVGDLKESIRESLRQHGITLFAYIFMAKQSELDELAEEELADEE